MNNLVDYGGSDSENSDDEANSRQIRKEDGTSKTVSDLLPHIRDDSSSTAPLPEAKLEAIVKEHTWEKKEAPDLPNTKKRRLVRLALPELPAEDSDEESNDLELKEREKMKQLHKQSGLLSSLPAPLNKAGARLQLPRSLVQPKSGKKPINSKLNSEPVDGNTVKHSGLLRPRSTAKQPNLVANSDSTVETDGGLIVGQIGSTNGIIDQNSSCEDESNSTSHNVPRPFLTNYADDSDASDDELQLSNVEPNKFDRTSSESGLDFLGLTAKPVIAEDASKSKQPASFVDDSGPNILACPPSRSAELIDDNLVESSPIASTDAQSWSHNFSSQESSGFLSATLGESPFTNSTAAYQSTNYYETAGFDPMTAGTSTGSYLPLDHHTTTSNTRDDDDDDLLASLPPEVLAQMGRDKKAMGALMKSKGVLMVDGRADSLLGDVQQTLLKNRTEEAASGMRELLRKTKEGPQPTSLQKQKHQITYLAHHAKEREALLQQEWAANRHSKRQTQSRYGFI